MDIDNHFFRDGERADLVFQTVEIKPGFTAQGCINLRQQRRGNIDATHPPFERGSRESSQIRHDTTSHAHENGRSMRPPFTQHRPNPADAFNRLILFPAIQNRHVRGNPIHLLKQAITKTDRVFIRHDK